MKRKKLQNNSGISISDSIVMSVKKKRADLRRPLSVLIAIIGFASVLMSFLGMFGIQYDAKHILMSAVGFSAFYIILSVIGGRALWIYAVSVVVFLYSAYRRAGEIALGFKFLYNNVYSQAFKTEIQYFKTLKADLEEPTVTMLLFFYIWLLAIVLYFFTICRPNPVIPLMVTFPVIELGLYNGIEIPIFWGMLCIAYWLALLAMSTIDIGEYSGGQSGFVRKNDLFFPKRHMKLKVTEKCGLFIIASIMIVSGITTHIMKVTDYKRSESIQQKRRDITEAVSNFSVQNLAESVSNLTSAFGFEFEYDNHKLGTSDHVKYKDVTDLTVTLDQPVPGAVYLKDYAGSVYDHNEWKDLPEEAYNDPVFDDFEECGIYPQDLAGIFAYYEASPFPNNILVKNSKKKSKHAYVPYGTDYSGDLIYNKDKSVSPKDIKNGEASYEFIYFDAENVAYRMSDFHGYTYFESEVGNPEWREKIADYCNKKGMFTSGNSFHIESPIYPLFTTTYSDENGNTFTSTSSDVSSQRSQFLEKGDVLMAQLLESDYRSFVYEHYLQLPDTPELEEVRSEYSDILELAEYADTAYGRIALLGLLKNRITESTEYTLDPGKTPSNRDFANYFLLENHKGYCTHYATAGVLLARMAGIPARYATGYVIVGNDFSEETQNSDGTYTIDIKDSRSHAWAEVYLDGFGWVPLEFTAGYSQQEINTEPTTVAEDTTETTDESATTTEGNTDTSDRNETSSLPALGITTSSRVQATTTTTTVTNISGGFGFGFIKGSGSDMPDTFQNILLIIMGIACLIGLIFLRRYIIIRSRERRFTSGMSAKRARNMYSYAERLLGTLKLKCEGGRFTEFARNTERQLSGEYFEKGGFEQLTDVALRASFGKGTPTPEELKDCRRTVDDLSANIYKKASFLNKIKLRFLSVLK